MYKEDRSSEYQMQKYVILERKILTQILCPVCENSMSRRIYNFKCIRNTKEYQMQKDVILECKIPIQILDTVCGEEVITLNIQMNPLQGEHDKV